MTSINDLPPELLGETLLLCFSLDDPETYRFLEALRLVCSNWNQIVTNSPSFWTYICVRDSPTRADLALERSGSLPLDVYAAARCDEISYVAQEAFMARVIPHSHRWKIATLAVSANDTYRMNLEDIPVPLLEELTIVRFNRDADDAALRPFRSTPKLRKLIIFGYPLPWNSSMLTNLHTLIMTFIPQISAEGLALIFTRNPSIEILYLHMAGILYPNDPLTWQMPEAELPKLRRLRASVEPGFFTPILRKLVIPNVESLIVVESFANPGNEEELSLAISTFFEHLARPVVLGVKPFGFGLKLSARWADQQSDTFPFQIDMGGANIRRCVVALNEELRQDAYHRLTRLILTFEYWANPPLPDLLYTASAALNGVHEIRIWAKNGLRSFLRTLDKSMTSGGWSYPHLSKLVIHHHKSPPKAEAIDELLLDTLKTRYQTENGPTPLRELHFLSTEPPDDGWVKELEDVLGPGVFRWSTP